MNFLASVLLFSTLAAASPLLLPRQSAGNIIIIESSIKASGTACPSGTDIVVGTEKQAVTFGLNSAVVALGDGPRDKTCTVTFNIQYPAGCAAKANIRATHLGFAEVQNGAATTLQGWYTLSTGRTLFPGEKRFQGRPWDQPGGSDFKNEDVLVADVAANQPRVASVFVQWKIGVRDNGRKGAVATMAVDHLTLNIVDQVIGSCQAPKAKAG
jgi:hypothetical protein